MPLAVTIKPKHQSGYEDDIAESPTMSLQPDSQDHCQREPGRFRKQLDQRGDREVLSENCHP
jgi:hypothetical protein